MNKPFTREPRYIVVKVKDADAALTPTEQTILRMIGNKVAIWRTSQGKTNLSGVFVEHDWPEHELVWKMIEQRTTAADTTPTPVPWPRPYTPQDAPLVWPEIDYQAACVHEWANVEPFAKNPVRLACGLCGKLELMELAT